MLAGKRKWVLEHNLHARITESAAINGATVLNFEEPLSHENLALLSTYVTILLIDKNRKRVWVN